MHSCIELGWFRDSWFDDSLWDNLSGFYVTRCARRHASIFYPVATQNASTRTCRRTRNESEIRRHIARNRSREWCAGGCTKRIRYPETAWKQLVVGKRYRATCFIRGVLFDNVISAGLIDITRLGNVSSYEWPQLWMRFNFDKHVCTCHVRLRLYTDGQESKSENVAKALSRCRLQIYLLQFNSQWNFNLNRRIETINHT